MALQLSSQYNDWCILLTVMVVEEISKRSFPRSWCSSDVDYSLLIKYPRKLSDGVISQASKWIRYDPQSQRSRWNNTKETEKQTYP